MHTSGTTSEPRAIELSYGNWLANALGSAVALGLAQKEQRNWIAVVAVLVSLVMASPDDSFCQALPDILSGYT